jgi:hypothetical protein
MSSLLTILWLVLRSSRVSFITITTTFHFLVLYELVTRDCDFRSESYVEKVATFGNWSLFIIYL